MSKGPLVTDGDLKAAASATAFAADAIERHMSSEMYRNAVTANEYYRQHNVTINRFVQKIYSCSGAEAEDFTASKLRLASNLFKRLNVQRCTYSLGKGVSFVDVSAGGKDTTKEGLGDRFDDDVMEMGLKALIHGVSFPFWNLDHIDVFTADEFCPVWDEYSGALYAGVRFWRLDSDHPWHATLYEQDGYTEMVSGGSGFDFEVAEAKRAYKVTYQEIPADGMKLAVDAENYSRLPIVAVWGSDAHQSTLVGMRESIDAYDLIKSGLVNDTRDCAQIYWLINGAGGMDDRDLDLWRAKLKLTHVAEVDAEQGQSVTPYTQEVPIEGRKETLAQIKADIYEDFGALDVHTIAAGRPTTISTRHTSRWTRRPPSLSATSARVSWTSLRCRASRTRPYSRALASATPRSRSRPCVWRPSGWTRRRSCESCRTSRPTRGRRFWSASSGSRRSAWQRCRPPWRRTRRVPRRATRTRKVMSDGGIAGA